MKRALALTLIVLFPLTVLLDLFYLGQLTFSPTTGGLAVGLLLVKVIDLEAW